VKTEVTNSVDDDGGQCAGPAASPARTKESFIDFNPLQGGGIMNLRYLLETTIALALAASLAWFAEAQAGCGTEGCAADDAACSEGKAASTDAASAAVKSEQSQTVVYQIEGASCPVGCGAKVTKALKGYAGIANFSLDKKNWLATVTFKEGEDHDKFVNYFNEKTGFSAKEVKPSEKDSK
jgi:hypothetical protein